MATSSKIPCPQDLRKGLLPRRSIQEILQRWTRSKKTSSRAADATSKPAVEISAKGRDEPVVRNLTMVTSSTLLLGISSSDILLQAVRSSSTLA
jgi:hypothetical protein